MNVIELLKTNELCGADYEYKSNKYHIGTVEIDAEMAYALMHDNRNRNIKKVNMQKICASITRDGWDVGISMLVFTDTGRLIDGQHRLKSVIDTDSKITTIYSVVPESPLAMRSIDRGAKRSLADDLRLAGELNTAMLSTIIRVAYVFYNGVAPEEYFAAEKYRTVATDAEYFRFYTSHKDYITTLVSHVSKYYKNLQRNVASVIGPRALAYLFMSLYEIEPEESINFFGAASSPKVVGCPDVILQLRQKLLDLERMSAIPSTRVVAAYFIKAWNAYISGESLPQLTFKGGGAHPEKFPKIKASGE